jgi:hypothetical protein
VARCIEHHFDDAFHVSVHGFETPGIHAEPPCYRGTNLIRVQVLSLDFAAFDYVLGQGSEKGFFLEGESESVHAPHESALLVADGSEPFS